MQIEYPADRSPTRVVDAILDRLADTAPQAATDVSHLTEFTLNCIDMLVVSIYNVQRQTGTGIKLAAAKERRDLNLPYSNFVFRNDQLLWATAKTLKAGTE